MALPSLVDRGLVLNHTRHLDEDARLIVLFREIGKIHVVAKGTQKITSKLRPLTELFAEGEFHLAIAPHGVSARLTGGKLIQSHRYLCEQWKRFEIASRMCETADVLLPARAPAPEVFDILHRSLQDLKDASDVQAAWLAFVIQLLKSLGHRDLMETSPLDPSLVEAELERILPRRLKSAV